MFTKSAFLTSLKHEAKIISHLASQVPEGKLDWRPTPGQRSTLELLQYLTCLGIASTDSALTGGWDRWETYAGPAKQVDPAGVPKAMQRQIAAITKMLAKTTDASLRRKQGTSWVLGKKTPLGEALIETVLKPLTAYRMQLFIYLKASGAAQLTTSDCWMGKAAKAAKAKKQQA